MLESIAVLVVSLICQTGSMMFSVYSIIMVPKVIKNKSLLTLALLLELANIAFQLTGVITLFQPIHIGRNYLGSFLCYGVAMLDLQILSLFAVLIPWLRGNRINICRVVLTVLYVASNLPVVYYHITENILQHPSYFFMLGYGFLIVLYDNIQSVYITTLIYMASKNKTEKLAISFKESLSLNCFILFMDLLGCAAIVGTLFTTGTVNDIFSCIFDATIGNHVSLLIQMFKKIVKLKFADTITSSVRSSQIKSANSIQSPTASQTGFPNPAVMKSSENVKEVVPSSSVSNEKVALSNQVNDENSDKFTSNLKQFYKKEIVQRNGSKIERRPSAQK